MMSVSSFQKSKNNVQDKNRGTHKTAIGHQSVQVKQILNSAKVQHKLIVGSANDPLEREADQVADKVAGSGADQHLSTSVTNASIGNIIRRSTVSPFTLGPEVIPDSDQQEDRLQSKSNSKAQQQTNSAQTANQVAKVMATPGKALPAATQDFMQGQFQHNFDHVRVHTGEHADKATQMLNARAFAMNQHLVFASGQYSPDTSSGKWLLAHELTHVVQQSNSSGTTSAKNASQTEQDKKLVSSRDNQQTIRRVRWNTARDTGTDSYPWGPPDPVGDLYRVQTDAGNEINAWKPHDDSTYWCHGYTFGGWNAPGGPFSIPGNQVEQVLADDGWQLLPFSCVTQADDVLLFKDTQVQHTGIVHSAFEPNGQIDEVRSMLDSKWGSTSQNRSSWFINATKYTDYSVYSKSPASGPCSAKGDHER